MDSEGPLSSYTRPMTEQEAIYWKIAEGIEKERLDSQSAQNSKAKLEDEAKKQEVEDKQEDSQTVDPKRLEDEDQKQEVENNHEDDDGELKKAEFDRGADCMRKLCAIQNIPEDQKDVLFSLYYKSTEKNKESAALAIYETVVAENVKKVVEQVRIEFNVTPELVALSKSMNFPDRN